MTFPIHVLHLNISPYYYQSTWPQTDIAFCSYQRTLPQLDISHQSTYKEGDANCFAPYTQL